MQSTVAWIRKNEGQKGVETCICYVAWEDESGYEITTSWRPSYTCLSSKTSPRLRDETTEAESADFHCQIWAGQVRDRDPT